MIFNLIKDMNFFEFIYFKQIRKRLKLVELKTIITLFDGIFNTVVLFLSFFFEIFQLREKEYKKN